MVQTPEERKAKKAEWNRNDRKKTKEIVAKAKAARERNRISKVHRDKMKALNANIITSPNVSSSSFIRCCVALRSNFTFDIYSALFWILGVLCIDATILIVWQIVNPLHWTRVVLHHDKYGETLASIGMCTMTHWEYFAGTMAIFHFYVD